jgi:hypothetical protein
MNTSPNGRFPLSCAVLRALATIDAGRRVAVADAQATAAVASARLDSLTEITRAAVDEVASLSRWEGELAEWAPSAAGRLRTVLDVAAVNYALVIDTTTDALTTERGQP